MASAADQIGHQKQGNRAKQTPSAFLATGKAPHKKTRQRDLKKQQKARPQGICKTGKSRHGKERTKAGGNGNTEESAIPPSFFILIII